MPPMKPEDHEEILNKLLNPELDQMERTNLLNDLRADYGTVITDHRENTETLGKLKQDKETLLMTNSQLFRERGIQQYPPEDQKEIKQKEIAETIQVDDIINKLGGL